MQTARTPQREGMTVEEAAVRLGIGRRQAYEAARRGDLPGAIRIGRRIIVSRTALDRALGVIPFPVSENVEVDQTAA